MGWCRHQRHSSMATPTSSNHRFYSAKVSSFSLYAERSVHGDYARCVQQEICSRSKKVCSPAFLFSICWSLRPSHAVAIFSWSWWFQWWNHASPHLSFCRGWRCNIAWRLLNQVETGARAMNTQHLVRNQLQQLLSVEQWCKTRLHKLWHTHSNRKLYSYLIWLVADLHEMICSL